MSRVPRALRNVAAAALVAGLFAGTFIWRTDDTWPLAQMRMFPGGRESDVTLVVIQAEHADGSTSELEPGAFHLKRAEIEGQLRRVIADPSMLGSLTERFNESAAADERIVRLTLVRRRGGRHDGIETEVARWPR
jgi:hypothetical protein